MSNDQHEERAPETVEEFYGRVRGRVDADCRARFDELARRTDAFCERLEPLAEEYRLFCWLMAATLCHSDGDEPLAADRSKPTSWAAAIVWTVGQNNFLTDPSFEPTMSADEVAAGFGVATKTMQAKATRIRQHLDIENFDTDWTLPSLLHLNPLVWIVETKQGLLVDVRNAPREVQVKAYEKGLIPYVYADEHGEYSGLQVVETGDDADGEEDDGPPAVIGRIHRG